MVDSLKYLALKSYGGLVIDLNFMLKNHDLSNFFDLFSGIFLTSDDNIENFFVAANKGNSAINYMSKIIDKMFDDIENKDHCIR